MPHARRVGAAQGDLQRHLGVRPAGERPVVHGRNVRAAGRQRTVGHAAGVPRHPRGLLSQGGRGAAASAPPGAPSPRPSSTRRPSRRQRRATSRQRGTGSCRSSAVFWGRSRVAVKWAPAAVGACIRRWGRRYAPPPPAPRPLGRLGTCSSSMGRSERAPRRRRRGARVELRNRGSGGDPLLLTRGGRPCAYRIAERAHLRRMCQDGAGAGLSGGLRDGPPTADRQDRDSVAVAAGRRGLLL